MTAPLDLFPNMRPVVAPDRLSTDAPAHVRTAAPRAVRAEGHDWRPAGVQRWSPERPHVLVSVTPGAQCSRCRGWRRPEGDAMEHLTDAGWSVVPEPPCWVVA